MLQAVRQAAEETAFSGQIADLGLEPWAVKKVFGALPPGVRGGSDLITTQFAPRLGRSLADVAAEPHGLLQDRFARTPPTLGFRLLASTAGQEQDRRDFFGGIVLPPGCAWRGDSCRRRRWRISISGNASPRNAATCRRFSIMRNGPSARSSNCWPKSTT